MSKKAQALRSRFAYSRLSLCVFRVTLLGANITGRLCRGEIDSVSSNFIGFVANTSSSRLVRRAIRILAKRPLSPAKAYPVTLKLAPTNSSPKSSNLKRDPYPRAACLRGSLYLEFKGYPYKALEEMEDLSDPFTKRSGSMTETDRIDLPF